MEVAQRSVFLERRELENEIRNALYNECAEFKNLEFVLPNTPDVISPSPEMTSLDMSERKKSKSGIERDIKNAFYNKYAEYKSVIIHTPKYPKQTDGSSVNGKKERKHSSRREGRVEYPDVDRETLRECGTPNELNQKEDKRSRNVSDSSFFSQRKVQDSGDDDEMCCEVNIQYDRVCPSRLNGLHGRYSVDNINNPSAIKCLRWRMRRNALCDPLRMLLPQYTRERLERDNERKKASVTRKVSKFVITYFDLNRDEDLI